jgi:hypothetical protein
VDGLRRFGQLASLPLARRLPVVSVERRGQGVRRGRNQSLMSECHATNLNRRLPASDHMTAVALAEMDLALGRPGRARRQLAEALGRIWAYSRRQQSWFRKLGASRIDRRSAVKTFVSRPQ